MSADPASLLPRDAIVLSHFRLSQDQGQLDYIDIGLLQSACLHYRKEGDAYLVTRRSPGRDVRAVKSFRIFHPEPLSPQGRLEAVSGEGYLLLCHAPMAELERCVAPLTQRLGWSYRGLSLGFEADAPHGRCEACREAFTSPEAATWLRGRLCEACARRRQEEESIYCAQFICEDCGSPLGQLAEVKAGLCHECDWRKERQAMRRLGAVPD